MGPPVSPRPRTKPSPQPPPSGRGGRRYGAGQRRAGADQADEDVLQASARSGGPRCTLMPAARSRRATPSGDCAPGRAGRGRRCRAAPRRGRRAAPPEAGRASNGRSQTTLSSVPWSERSLQLGWRGQRPQHAVVDHARSGWRARPRPGSGSSRRSSRPRSPGRGSSSRTGARETGSTPAVGSSRNSSARPVDDGAAERQPLLPAAGKLPGQLTLAAASARPSRSAPSMRGPALAGRHVVDAGVELQVLARPVDPRRGRTAGSCSRCSA